MRAILLAAVASLALAGCLEGGFPVGSEPDPVPLVLYREYGYHSGVKGAGLYANATSPGLPPASCETLRGGTLYAGDRCDVSATPTQVAHPGEAKTVPWTIDVEWAAGGPDGKRTAVAYDGAGDVVALWDGSAKAEMVEHVIE